VHEKPETDKVNKLVDVFAGLGIHAKFDVENPTCYDYQKLVKQIEDDPRKYTLMKVILRSMMKAGYSEKCLGHFGIASTFYCHFTSPIRRYPDLMIHRIIKRFISGTKPKELHIAFDEIVKTSSDTSSLTEKKADEVERAVDDYKKALYMHEHLGEKYVGTISGVHDFGVFVELENTIEGLIRFEFLPVDSYDYDDKTQVLKGKKHQFKLGDKIEVICVNANVRLRKIDFDLAERLNSASIEEILTLRNAGYKKALQEKTKTEKSNKKKEKAKPKKAKKITKQYKKKKGYSRKNLRIEY
ncbi:MAG: RNB domain-containing ribonuclease, partial [Clostridia bacterium]|nr:RNB domain-containing ribonuclease [Clostridia bacterium]